MMVLHDGYYWFRWAHRSEWEIVQVMEGRVFFIGDWQAQRVVDCAERGMLIPLREAPPT